MLTQLQEKCFYQHCLSQLGSKADWKNCQEQLHLHSSLHQGSPKNAQGQCTDRPTDSTQDRSCKFGSGCPEKGAALTALTDSPFSCQHWP